MQFSRISSYLLLYAALSPSALARRGVAGEGSFGAGRDGPFVMTAKQFDEALKSPNATGKFDFPGVDISQRYTGTFKNLSGWAWDIAVAADVQMGGEYFTGTKISITAPGGAPRLNGSRNLTVHETWQACVLHWDLSKAYDDKLRSDDENCTHTLGSDCVRDIEFEVEKAYRSAEGCHCPDFGSIKSCKGKDVVTKNECLVESKHPVPRSLSTAANTLGLAYNNTEIEQWPDGKLDVVRYGGPTHAKGDIAAYNQNGSLGWPLLFVLGVKSKPWFDVVDRKAIKLSCVRARDATEGSVAPKAQSDKSSGYRNSLGTLVMIAMPLFWALWL
ncbi:uncharacterized protein E0L32_004559 [Thyridium curvatum]|uniref:Uncharacterized protein n=1 Tax=Thyridium curvatum TaxID=1093900 RepID=A0A507AZ70_9PEZI|nr:uncharacterized protein E0L32_004559 [Thyridium curvatum]TPX15282.1 hypothetical protein E0L32_004559 [Thyridium curvatum]